MTDRPTPADRGSFAARPPVNTRTGAEGRLLALVFNGLTHALGRDEFMVLSRRAAVTEAIVDLLMANGLEPKFRSGLQRLRDVDGPPVVGSGS